MLALYYFIMSHATLMLLFSYTCVNIACFLNIMCALVAAWLILGRLEYIECHMRSSVTYLVLRHTLGYTESQQLKHYLSPHEGCHLHAQ
jgi:hypothetical protein